MDPWHKRDLAGGSRQVGNYYLMTNARQRLVIYEDFSEHLTCKEIKKKNNDVVPDGRE